MGKPDAVNGLRVALDTWPVNMAIPVSRREIIAVLAYVAELEGALEPFADFAAQCEESPSSRLDRAPAWRIPDDRQVYCDAHHPPKPLTVGIFRQAAAALTGGEKGGG